MIVLNTDVMTVVFFGTNIQNGYLTIFRYSVSCIASCGALAISTNLIELQEVSCSCCEKDNATDKDVHILMVNILPLIIT